MATKKSSKSPQDNSFLAELEAVEQDLYWSHYDGSSPERKAALEGRWNALKAQEKGPSWTYKVDRRSTFQNTTKTMVGPSGRKTGEYVIVEGEFHPKNETISWRSDTKIGQKIDQRARGNTEKLAGHQAGHICPMDSGIDPNQEQNLISQHAWMNQREWREMEAAIRKHVDANQEPVKVRFVSCRPDRLDGQEAGRWVEVKALKKVDGQWVEVSKKEQEPIQLPGYGSGSKNDNRLLNSEALRYLNPPDRVAERNLPPSSPSPRPAPPKSPQNRLDQQPPIEPGQVLPADFASYRAYRAEQKAKTHSGPKPSR